ncbi:MAG: nicotinate-nucleotide adenylyltransferase [Aphanocapsa feldmannii 277cV]|uniref:nicotinate-nucleotide adenylyltransferase n=2 Tax=Aphanocapsa feldmannii TaxID=192050 RepID=A0A524RKP4_9CHRO|nr:MAG: nicotinate-nucleotide adenylyltransferase [Aphanocapsa feldmannii 288cV]TGG90449.1 MAG: nicotinate-nucleotide adenylyltransferase [Aphanocapsa feldmannii 277cV]TGH21953.1 MAG: nicotinate-nucleotide adenylyltransferase [Aphanocapsa feldmannii 277cI]
MTPSGAATPRAALFGTSADPPTVAHQAVLAGLAERFPLVLTWASDNPVKRHRAPLAVRQALLAAVIEGLGRGRAVQLRQDFSSPRALQSVERAGLAFPAHQLVFVVGADLVPQIPGWWRVDALLRRCTLAVVPRLGWALPRDGLLPLQRLGARIEQLPLQIPAAASSALRRHPDPGLVPPHLLATLAEQRLYGFGRQV